MPRVTRSKLLYLSVLIACVGTGIYLGIRLNSLPLLAGLVVLLLLPGRVQAYFWRNFYKGRRALGLQRFTDAQKYFEAFLVELARQAWLERLSVITWQIYTPNVRAMTLNNLGVAHLYLAEVDLAEQVFHEAIKLDVDYPKPYYNLALLCAAKGQQTEADNYLTKAVQLGFSGGLDDVLVSQLGQFLASANSKLS
jgi:tetratricopeptide (TPR) repeat protein